MLSQAHRITTTLLCGAMAGALALGTAASAREAPFTIDQVMGAPYPASLAAAPVGRAVAWVFDARGARNVWVSDGSGPGGARQVTSFTGDDGNDMGELTWSPDARLLAFTRGQTIEDDAPANVASTAAGPTSREIWMASATGGEARKVGMGHSPGFSPDGSRLVFADKHQLIAVDLAGNAAPKPLLTDFGAIGATAWSPDGRRLAFVSRRKGHALVGVYEVATRRISWMAPDMDSDGAPVFSPDGTRVAFVRVATEKVQPFVAHRTGTPWSIWVADAATGTGRRVWVADQGTGSVFHPSLSARNLLWAADDRLVFPWEKTGWLLPYSVEARGGDARPLASGALELAYMTLSPDRRRVVFSSNQGDVDRLHVWTADVARGGAPAPVGRDDNIEAFPEVAADGTVFALQSGARTPLHPVMFDRGAWRPLAPAATAGFPADRLVTPTSVTFQAKDGLTTHGQLFLPPGGTSPHPAILFFHGGPPRQMLVGFHYMGAYSRMYALNEYLAAKGYVVLSVNYRGGIGYGLDYREAKDFGAGGGSEVNDLLGAVGYLQGRSDVDRSRIGIWGGSYGGLMTALGLARASDSIAVGVDYAGVYDWASMMEQLGAPIEDPAANRLAIASSPVATIDRWRSPVLVIQADDDRNVPFPQSLELVQDLRAHGVEHETMLLPNEVHDLSRYASWMAMFDATAGYLDKHLDHPGAPATRR